MAKENATERRRRQKSSDASDQIELLTYKELSTILRVHECTLQRMVARGSLKPIRVGRRVFFDKAKTLEALKRKRRAAVAKTGGKNEN